MSYTREQSIERIEGYFPGRDMKPLAVLIDEAIANVFVSSKSELTSFQVFPQEPYDWHNLTDEILEELAHLCCKAGNDFELIIRYGDNDKLSRRM